MSPPTPGSTFPAQIDNSLSLPPAIDGKTNINAQALNLLRNAIIGIENTLGLNPQGTFTTVRARLDFLQTHGGGGGGGGGFTPGGDLGGTGLSQLVIGLYGHPLSSDIPLTNQFLGWNGSAWLPTFVQSSQIAPSYSITLTGPTLVEVGATVFNPLFMATYSSTPTTAIFTDNQGNPPLNVITVPAPSTQNEFFYGLSTTTGTTVAVASNGAVLPQAIINVASTTGFTTSGIIYVISTAGQQTISYTGITPTSFTGCSGGVGTINTGNQVIANPIQYQFGSYGASVLFTLTSTSGLFTGTATNTLTWTQPVFLGSSPDPGPGGYTSTFIQTLPNSYLTLQRANTFSINNIVNQYIFFCYRSAYNGTFGEPQFSAFGWNGGFNQVATTSVTNVNGFTENYDVWRSDYSGLGFVTVSVF